MQLNPILLKASNIKLLSDVELVIGFYFVLNNIADHRICMLDS
jgi:hypothetical protein